MSVPYDIEKPDPSLEPVLASSKVPTSLTTVYNASSPETIAGLKWALERGRPVDVDLQVVLTDATLEGFEDVVGKATEGVASPPPIILCMSLISILRKPRYSSYLPRFQPTCFRHLMILIFLSLS